MTILEKVLFAAGDYNKKKSYIDNMLVDELMQVSKSIVKSIIIKAGNDYGRFCIGKKFRKGNEWNSEIESVSLSKDNVFVDVYIQTDKTDTTESEYFDSFFRRGEYYSRDNRFNMGVDYKESQKAEVMRSILLECVYRLFSDEQKIAKNIARLSHYTLINPVCNHFYGEYRLRYKNISRYSSRDTIAEIKGYHHAEQVLRKYIEENYIDLEGKTNEELNEIYMKVFGDSMRDFIKTFDYNEWAKDRIFLW